MGCFGIIFFAISSSLLLQSNLITAQYYSYHFCLGRNYSTTTNSTFEANLNLLLASISARTTPNSTKFYTNSVGREPDRVYGLFQCRGDYDGDDCKKFADEATKEIITKCPYKTEAVIFYDECWLHYSDKSFVSTVQLDPAIRLRTPANISSPSQFTLKFPELMNSLVVKAVSPNLFAVGQANLTVSQNIYGLVQCTQDLNRSDCNECLKKAISEFASSNRRAAIVYTPSCIAMYADYQFFIFETLKQDSGPPPPPLAISPPKYSHRTAEGIIPTSCHNCASYNVRNTVQSLQLNFATVEAATSNFCNANKLGEGGFGVVYKGILSDGREIAVKRLSRNSVQGVEVAKLQHKNLVRLLGFCVEGDEKLLIYEFVPNGSLDHYISGAIKLTLLDWEKRYRIIGGVARGLLYLHEDSRDRIIHRDLKPSNVLLDELMNPKISDFGLARLVMVDQTLGCTKRVVGTYVYMAPEYATRGHFSVKSDVFSFGVLVLETITGQKNSRYYESQGDKYLLSYVWKNFLEGTAAELLEAQLRENYCRTQVLRCIQIGLLCVQGDVAKRPMMASVVVMLNSNSVTLPSPSAPAYFVNTTVQFSAISDELDMSQSGSSLSTLHGQSIGTSTDGSIAEVSASEFYPR